MEKLKFKSVEAILNGEINNNKKDAENYMYKIGEELKLINEQKILVVIGGTHMCGKIRISIKLAK